MMFCIGFMPRMEPHKEREWLITMMFIAAGFFPKGSNAFCFMVVFRIFMLLSEERKR